MLNSLRKPLTAAALAAATLAPAVGHAAGIGRPNVGAARSIGWGSAFIAIADDPTALHFNPAGMATQEHDTILFGGSFVMAPRRYTPITIDPATGMSTRGANQDSQNTPIELPTLGYVTRLSENGVPSRLALGFGIWNTYGGQLRYDKGPVGQAALDYTQTAVIEFVPGIAYQVNDFIQVGAAFRLGLGLFAVEATDKPATGNFSGLGLGAGASFGIMIEPTDTLRVGATYRSSLTTHITGSGYLILQDSMPDNKTNVDITHEQQWPQSAGIGAHWQASHKLGFAIQADWTDWSSIDKLIIKFKQDAALTQTFPVDFHDSYQFHIGAEYLVSDTVAVRAGYTFDSNAVPDRTIERQYLDNDKNVLALGGSYAFSKRWRLDTAFEYIGGAPRVVPDNRQQYVDAGFPSRANIAPGEHSGQVYALELNVQFQY